MERVFAEKRVEVVFHRAETARFEGLPKWRGSYVPYVRLLLQDILADEDFTIYTDVDTLWLRDVGELWAKRSDDVVLQAVPDGGGMRLFSFPEETLKMASALGVSLSPETYFCSGLLLMNLRALRADGFTQRVFDLLTKHGSAWMNYPDQDIYNVVYPSPKTRLLDPLWGEFSVAYGLCGVRSPRVVHYAKAAPWKRSTHFSAVQMLWWDYLAKRVGFDGLGAEAAHYRWAYRMRAARYAWLRNRRRFAATYAFPALINKRVYKKQLKSFFPETRCAELMSDVRDYRSVVTVDEGQPLIRVIISIYNAAETIDETLASLRAQTFTQWECVCVDDGSTDDSAARIRAFADEDARFRLVQQPNGGPGVARNTGMAGAQTTWLFFIDADDILHPKAFETLLAFATETTDCVGAGFTRERSELSVYGRVRVTDYPGEELFSTLSPRMILTWGRLWRRSCVDGLQFPPWKNHEDTAWNLLMFKRLRQEVFIEAPMMWYRPSPNGLSSQTAYQMTVPRLWRYVTERIPEARARFAPWGYHDFRAAVRTQNQEWIDCILPVLCDNVLDLKVLSLRKQFNMWRWKRRCQRHMHKH